MNLIFVLSLTSALSLLKIFYQLLNILNAVGLAKGVLVTVRDNWRIIAEKNGLSKSSIEYMKPAFGATQI